MTLSIHERLAAAGLPPLPRKVWLEIDLGAIANNVAVFRELIGPGVSLNAVVKADAYGHGLVPVARALERAGVDRLCVASLDEAAVLRRAGIESDILVLFSVPDAVVDDAAHNGVEVSISFVGDLDDFGWVAAEVEVETGLTRAGIKPDDLPEVLHSAQASDGRKTPSGIWSHIASPENEAATAQQVAAFDRAVELAFGPDRSMPPRHIAATGALLAGGVPFYEGVRIGLGIYGLIPDGLPIPAGRRTYADRLRPAMALKCEPLRVETFPKGTAVGYGGTWVAQRDSVIATLPVGYGDGFARAYSPGAEALVRGNRVPLVGTVAMDAVMADVTDVPGVNLGDEFVLLGNQGAESITANDLARLRNTIPWEVVTSMSFRLPRVYHADSVLLGTRTLDGETLARAEAVE